jgi:hypothetical protein
VALGGRGAHQDEFVRGDGRIEVRVGQDDHVLLVDLGLGGLGAREGRGGQEEAQSDERELGGPHRVCERSLEPRLASWVLIVCDQQ